MAAFLASAATPEARQSADDIARAIVIGQAYTSGNIYVAGFVDDPKREWPRRVWAIPLTPPTVLRTAAEFSHAVPPDSEEQHYFSQREDGGSAGPDDLFSTIDGMVVTDSNLALYRAVANTSKPMAIFGWDSRVQVTDVSYRDKDHLRPISQAERLEIDEEKKAIPKDFECTTEPQYLDSAEVILTGRIAKTNLSIRVSSYQTPGCAGHLSEIYILDVLEPGRDPRRFEFRHYVGVL